MIDYSGSLVNMVTAHAFLEAMVEEDHTGCVVTVGASATGLAVATLARHKKISVPGSLSTRTRAACRRTKDHSGV